MRAKFIGGKHPNFGIRVPSRRNLEGSVYYWWYRYLTRNEKYRATCEQGGVGECAALYQDFGDVRIDTDEAFHKWWSTKRRGESLFAERALGIMEITKPEQLIPAHDKLYLEVPLQVPRRALRDLFERALVRRLGKGQAGRRYRSTTAKYPVLPHEVMALGKHLKVYDAVNAAKESGTPRWKVAVETEVAFLNASRGELDADQRHEAAKAVRVHYRKAQSAIKNAALGRFPDYT